MDRFPKRHICPPSAIKTKTLIAAALRHGVEGFVFSSTCALYGLPQTEFLNERRPFHFESSTSAFAQENPSSFLYRL
jgi:UDP-glucose 4-epimerase